MKRHRLNESGDRGWFIGAFNKAIWKTTNFEVGYMFNHKGTISPKHIHKKARELSLITSGCVIANGERFGPGYMFEIMPGEELHCEYIEDTTTVCVKSPSVPVDKYYV